MPDGMAGPPLECAVFDLNIYKLLVLAVLAVIIFGPEQLPKIAGQAGRALRELRRMADGASEDLRDSLGPEFADFDVSDLHPRTFVRKHLLDGFDSPSALAGDSAFTAAPTPAQALAADERPPYDHEAT